ncbi:MAG: TauD/TfdA family dioxygenase, partial [Acetobacteraceae bacterium]|nr:TauD/TfdA family dioxygenase [Acetobacteraceae bacterium]
MGTQTTTAAAVGGAAPIEVVPTGAALGAEVRGVDLRRVDDALFAAIHAAWLAHSVLLFRGQSLSDDDLVAFSRRFGDLDWAPVQENGRRFVDGKPEIYIVSNVLGADGQPIGSLGAGEAAWHTDMSYLPRPPKASMLYALEVPPAGGDTHFASMHAAFDALPEALKRRARGLKVKHDGTYNSGGFLRAGVTPTDDPRTSPGHLHPLACRHPESGRPMLYLGRRRNAYIDGLPLDESEALLDELWARATRPEIAWAHRWRPGDLV